MGVKERATYCRGFPSDSGWSWVWLACLGSLARGGEAMVEEEPLLSSRK